MAEFLDDGERGEGFREALSGVITRKNKKWSRGLD
jgi:hypothetical protein